MKPYAKIFNPFIVFGLLVGFCVITPASAEYPEKTITYIVPFKAGGGADRTARVLSTAAIDNFGLACEKYAWRFSNICMERIA